MLRLCSVLHQASTHSSTEIRGKSPGRDYVRRDPEKGLVFPLVSKYYRTFLQSIELEGKRLPRHVEREFEAYLDCGIITRGFVRFACETCRHERIVALSCKKRGFCSSCGSRRMAETAAHLVDHVFPEVGIRQYVFSFPVQIRYLLLRDSKIQSTCLDIVHRALARFLKRRSGVGLDKASQNRLQTGSVTLIQRFGGSLNANPHFHAMVLEGAYLPGQEGATPEFYPLTSISDEDVQALVQIIAQRVIRALKRLGHFEDESEALAEAGGDSEEVLSEIQAASVGSKIALGKNRGHSVRRLGALRRVFTDTPEIKGPLCAAIQGFSLHAGVYCGPKERKKLERVTRYVARPAISEDRLSLDTKGEILYQLKKKYKDGTTHLLFSPLEFLEKLSALVPPPRIHLTRFHGCLGPHSKIRSLIVPRPQLQEKTGASQVPQPHPEEKVKTKSDPPNPAIKRKLTWAQLLARVFGIDMSCPNCHTDLKPISAVFDPQVITRILEHLKIPTKPPDLSPAQLETALEF